MNLDYHKLYESQNDMNISSDMKKYKKYFNLYSIKNKKNPKCLFCRKKKLIRKKENDKISINCTNSKCKWNVIMSSPNYVNIYLLYNDLDNSDNLIKINKIIKNNFENKIYQKNKKDKTNYENEFEILKKEIKKNINDKKKIDKIFEIQEKELDILKNKKYNNYKKLNDLKTNRNKYYTNVCFDVEIKNLLFEVYKNEFPINEKRTQEIATKYNIETTFIKNKLFWYDNVKQYIKTSNTLFETENELLNTKIKFKKTLSNFLIKCPEIKETLSLIKKRIGLVEKEEDSDDSDEEDDDENIKNIENIGVERPETIKIKIKKEEEENIKNIGVESPETIKIKIKKEEEENIKNIGVESPETIKIKIKKEEEENIENMGVKRPETIKIKIKKEEEENIENMGVKRPETIKIKIKKEENKFPIIKNKTIEINIENEMEGENIENEMEGENIENEMEGENIENEMEGENIENEMEGENIENEIESKN
jgi:hypothetical protein